MYDHVARRRRRRGGILAALALAGAVLATIGSVRPAAALPICDRPNPPPVCGGGDEPPPRGHNAVGALETVTFAPGSVRLTGWASDADTTGPINVQIHIDGSFVAAALANRPRGTASNGFDITVPASATSGSVCATAANVGLGMSARLGCRSFPYSTDVTLLDLCGVSSLPLTGRLWRLVPPTGQTVLETTTTAGSRLGFSANSSLGASVGVSLNTATLPGPLFRSGPLAVLPAGSPANAAGRITVTVPCPIGLNAAALNSLAGSVALPPMSGVTISSVGLIPGSNALTLIVGGTGTSGPFTAPFTYTLTFGLTPSTNMNNPAEVVLVAPTGPGTITFGGFWGGLLNSVLAPSVGPSITSSAVPAIQGGVNSAILTSAAGAFPGGSLPPGATVSMGRVVITPSGASFTAAVGWFG
jgi:hypothetical protein